MCKTQRHTSPQKYTLTTALKARCPMDPTNNNKRTSNMDLIGTNCEQTIPDLLGLSLRNIKNSEYIRNKTKATDIMDRWFQLKWDYAGYIVRLKDSRMGNYCVEDHGKDQEENQS